MSRWYAALPVLVALLAFGPAVPNADWVLDDRVLLAHHGHHGDLVGEWTHGTHEHARGTPGHVWRPLTASLQHVVALGFGRSAPVFRLLSLGLLAALGAAVAVTARRWGGSPAGAALAGLVVVLHRLTGDVVGWSAAAGDLLAGTLLALAVHACARPRGWVVGGLVLAAVLAKEPAAAVVPGLVALAWVAGGARRALEVGAAGGAAVAGFSVLHDRVAGSAYAAAVGHPKDLAYAALDQLGLLLGVPDRAALLHLWNPAEVPVGGLVVLGLSALTGGLLVQRRATTAPLAIALAVGVLALLVPPAIGVPYSGVQPVRYAFLPLVFAACLVPAVLAPFGRGGLLVLLPVLPMVPRTVARVWDYADEPTLLAAELRAEPDNPYAGVRWARSAYTELGREPPFLGAWLRALRACPAIPVVDLHEEWWAFAQGAFLAGRPDLAQAGLDGLLALGDPLPAQLPCLQADVLDARGLPGAARWAEACPPKSP